MKEAKALRLLRKDARTWWYHTQLRTWGNITEAKKREHQSIRDTIKLMRECKIEELNARRHYITFLKPQGNVTSWTTCLSGIHGYNLAAWIYLYAKGLIK